MYTIDLFGMKPPASGSMARSTCLLHSAMPRQPKGNSLDDPSSPSQDSSRYPTNVSRGETGILTHEARLIVPDHSLLRHMSDKSRIE